jgi:uncharacterized protein YllA (UPF0747 family)
MLFQIFFFNLARNSQKKVSAKSEYRLHTYPKVKDTIKPNGLLLQKKEDYKSSWSR